MLLRRFKRACGLTYAIFLKLTTKQGRRDLILFAAAIATIACLTGAGLIWQAISESRFHKLSSRQHLDLALAACGVKTNTPSGHCVDRFEAARQLAAIPTGCIEYPQATALIASLKDEENQETLTASQAKTQKFDAAYDVFQKNRNGERSDSFTCSQSTENKPIISFDNGEHWWSDDGRCSSKQQAAKDAGAETSSYISTTLRVDTDMDSFWLPDEERTCWTAPGDKGQIALVACNDSGDHRQHNIPVKFWGGVNRGRSSDWKCRREKNALSDQFVCRAID